VIEFPDTDWCPLVRPRETLALDAMRKAVKDVG
jgi:hypothetical protein